MEAGGFAAVGLREHADKAFLEGANVAAYLAKPWSKLYGGQVSLASRNGSFFFVVA